MSQYSESQKTLDIESNQTTMVHTLASQLSDCIVAIDHVAVAVENLDDAIAWYSSTLGFSLIERSVTNGAHSGMLYAVMKAGQATVVLVQGTNPQSQVSRFLAEFGPGIHHIGFTVTNLDEAMARIINAGGSTDTPIVSDTGIRQAFLPRDHATGVRIELIERQGDSFSSQNAERLFKTLEEKKLY
jgi:methylmalonyl-CoA/ethylmalonyl-CoA epimerase